LLLKLDDIFLTEKAIGIEGIVKILESLFSQGFLKEVLVVQQLREVQNRVNQRENHFLERLKLVIIFLKLAKGEVGFLVFNRRHTNGFKMLVLFLHLSHV